MPELPDLQIFSKNLKNHLAGKTITAAEIFNKSKVNIDESGLKAALTGTKTVDVARSGKEIYFYLENGRSFSVHLMLNGEFDICASSETAGIKYKIMSLELEDKTSLIISDLKGLCRVTFDPMIPEVPDALGEEFTFEYLLGAAKNSRKNIKAFLTDQNIIRGIGNAYADEILWKADISPESAAGKIPEEFLKKLYDSVSYILNDGIANIEAVSPNIIKGEERRFLKVHNPSVGKTAQGDKIIVKKINSKLTYFTEKQRLFK